MTITHEFQPHYCKEKISEKTPRDVIWIRAENIDDLILLQSVAEKYKMRINKDVLILKIFR